MLPLAESGLPTGSEYLRADVKRELPEMSARVAGYDGAAPLCVCGPPGSGKTSALAARAIRLSSGGPIVVVCPNAASCTAFGAAIQARGGVGNPIVVDTLAGHAAAWMRAEFAASGASPDLVVGSDVDSVALARAAGKPILDMTWPGFRSSDFTLDLPFLGRPDIFFEEAAALFRQLRRWGISADEFDVRCAAGLSEFYGEDVERARVFCADANVRSRASSRGRDALTADAARLRTQKHAERELSKLLSYLYREYRTAARGARVLCGEDVVDEALQWLGRDRGACERVAARFCAIIVDDAEDAEPAVAAIVELMTAAGLTDVAAAYSEASAIDGIGGRRIFMLGDGAHRVEFPPPVPAETPIAAAARFDGEAAEADAVAGSIRELLAQGTPPADIMVLARDADGAAVYNRLLGERGVPITASPTAWQAPHDIADLLALACIVADPYDHAHLMRVLSSPLVGLSDFSLLTLCRDPVDAGQLSLDVGLDDMRIKGARAMAPTTLADNALYGNADLNLADHARASLIAFRQRWSEWRRECANRSVPSALAYLIEAAGFRASWHAAPHHLRGRLANDATRLLAGAAGSSRMSLHDVACALEEGFGCIAPAADVPDAVACRTINGAKGLRKPYVFVMGVAHERFPRVYISRSMAFSKNFGLIVRENVAGPAPQTAKFAWYYAKYDAKQRYLEEERRALRYALSRATRAAHASGFGKPPRWAAGQDLLADHGA